MRKKEDHRKAERGEKSRNGNNSTKMKKKKEECKVRGGWRV